MSAFVVASFNRTESRAQKAALECLEQRPFLFSWVGPAENVCKWRARSRGDHTYRSYVCSNSQASKVIV